MPGSHHSLWEDTAERPARPALEETVSADVAIIGAGITGLTTALHLQESGFSVVVVEAGRVGSGTTGHTSAHLSSLWDGGYHELIRRRGREAARRVAAALQDAIAHIEELVSEHALDCSFGRVAGYFYAERGQSPDAVERELRAAQRLDLDVEAVRDVPLDLPVTAALRIADQARFHPLRYVLGLAEALEAGGGRIFERTRVVDVAEEERCCVTSATGARVLAREVVMATHLPIGISPLQTEAAPYRSYVIAFLVSDSDDEADALLWDSADPYHYTRELRDGARRWRIVGGADHKTGEEDARAAFERLERYARERHPVEKIAYRWSSQLYEPVDRLPFIGRAPLARHTWLATGFSGDGLTFGTHAGAMLADLVAGRGHEDEGLYRPTRIATAGLLRFLRENAGVARHLVGDRLALQPERELDALVPGQGCVVRSGLSPVAAWRDGDGALHRFSAVCPHLKCIVRWNAAERSFDCPCHGSRFDTDGCVIEGPALRGLERR